MTNTPEIKKASFWWYILAPCIALLGGLFAIIAAVVEEADFGGVFGIVVAAPIIEEALKPVGVYLLLAKWPHALRNQKYTAFLSSLSGLSFAVIENLIYLNIYVPDASQALIIWRYTICIAMHVGCSFLLGFGINQKLVAWVRSEVTFLKGNRKFFLIPMLIHAAYNLLVYFLEVQGILTI